MPKEVRIISYRSWSSSNEPVPLIAIQGLHLKSHGFDVGAKCRVSYAPGRIILELYEPTNSQPTPAPQPDDDDARDPS